MSDEEEKEDETEEQEVFKCEVCGQEFDNVKALGGHMNKHRDIKGEEDELEEIPDTDVPPDPEKQMYKEMAQVLKDEVALAPGGSEKKADYILHRFKNNDIYKKEDLRLFNLISNVCPKMKGDLVNDIVDAVFNVKEEYSQGAGMQRRRTLSHSQPDSQSMQRRSSPGGRQHSRDGRRTSQRGEEQPMSQEEIQEKIEEKAEALYEKRMQEEKREQEMKELKEQITQMNKRITQIQRGEIQNKKEDKESDFDKMMKFMRLMEEFTDDDNSMSPEEVIQKANVVTKGELEKMKKDQTIDTLKQEINQMREQMQYSRQSSGDFESDDAKIIAQSLDHVARKMDHGHETVEKLVGHLPEIMGNQGGQKQPLNDNDLKKIENELDNIEQERQTQEGTESSTSEPTQFSGGKEEQEQEALLEEELEADEIEEE